MVKIFRNVAIAYNKMKSFYFLFHDLGVLSSFFYFLFIWMILIKIDFNLISILTLTIKINIWYHLVNKIKQIT